MSYILDALKKSDQERHRKRGPTLASIHDPWPPQAPSGRRHTAVAAILVTMVLSGLGAGFLWYHSPKATGPETEPERVALQPSEAAVVHDDETIITEVTARVAAPYASKSSEQDTVPVQELWELPALLRADFPALTFSFHVHAEEPLQRAVIINNRRHAEGDPLTRELTLETITPEGVILQFRGHRVHIPIIDQW